MKHLGLVFTLLFLNSCKKEKPQISQSSGNDPVVTSHTEPAVAAETDTIFFFYEDSEKQKEYVLVHLLNQKFDKDSLCTADFKLDFIRQKTHIGSYQIQIKSFDKGSEWGGFLELDSVASPLKRICVGFAACGYNHHNFLFYTEGKKIDLVHEWISMTDSGWGSWGEIVSGTPQDFYFRMESYFPDDNDEQMGLNEFSDSAHFERKNNQWVKTLLTPKDKAYRSKKISFADFHKS